MSALQTDTTKFKQDFIGPLFIDTALDKTHYRHKDTTGLLLDGTYHVNRIKKGSAHTPQGIVDTFDGYQKALKNTLLNKLAIETPDNKIQEVTLKDVQKNLIIFLVLLWIMPPLIVRRSIIPKFRKTNKMKQAHGHMSTEWIPPSPPPTHLPTPPSPTHPWRKIGALMPDISWAPPHSLPFQ